MEMIPQHDLVVHGVHNYMAQGWELIDIILFHEGGMKIGSVSEFIFDQLGK